MQLGRWAPFLAALTALFVGPGCGARSEDDKIVLTFPTSAVGAEADVLERQLARFMRLHPEIVVKRRVTPDAADQRHQLYVEWLNAGIADPDVLQLDVIWTPELAAAGWILPLDRFSPDKGAFFDATIAANSYRGALFAMPWFVDVGMLYYRSDLIARPPATLEELDALAVSVRDRERLRYGLVWQGARYEGLVTVFVEYLGAFGGSIVDEGGSIAVDSNEAVAALRFMKDSLGRSVPREVLGWQEEQSRFAFQRGEAVFMRNWPYARSLFERSPESEVKGRFAVMAMPRAAAGRATAALGGSELAINARSDHPREAFELIEYLTQPEQMLERAEVAGQLPARRALYEDERLSHALGLPARQLLKVVEDARPRPPTPLYAELSQVLQAPLHAALSGQLPADTALRGAARDMRRVLVEAGVATVADRRRAPPSRSMAVTWSVRVAVTALGAWLAAILLRRLRRFRALRIKKPSSPDARLAWALVAPALGVVALVALFPIGHAAYESLHARDLRMPWRGAPFVGLDEYVTLFESAHFWGALARTALFVALSVSLELILGLGLALALRRTFPGQGLVRTVSILPWAIPTVVAALVWRFLFDAGTGLFGNGWLTDKMAAWVPLILADVWKTTPFVALLLLAGLSSIDSKLYDAARVDGASAVQQLFSITLPLLRPVLAVTLVFRTLDAFRVFDLVYVLTNGGPGNATEPIALHTFDLLLRDLRIGTGSAASIVIFAIAFTIALGSVRWLGLRPRELA